MIQVDNKNMNTIKKKRKKNSWSTECLMEKKNNCVSISNSIQTIVSM